jgi:cytochrome P450
VVLASDLPVLGDEAEVLAESLVAASGGQVEVVSFVRQVTFGVIVPYFGVPAPAQGRLDVWATRLFEFQFTGSPKDKALQAEVDEIAPAFRAHIDKEIARRKAAPDEIDDVLGRCLKRQRSGEPGYSDVEIRTALLCMVVGGPPQPPMVTPQAMEQLLRRPEALADAHKAAIAGNDARLHDIVIEAMRFEPLAPALPRIALTDWTIARGTRRATTIPKGATVLAAFASAMMDERRIFEPHRFKAGRLPYEYIHFGSGMHECFGRYINHATLHRMLKPLLRRPNVRRLPGRSGHLRKSGIFADQLYVCHD